MSYLYTADPHLGNEGALRYRPQFRTVTQMDRHIIRNYNDTTSDEDDLIIVGDFSLLGPDRKGSIEKYITKLNGRKHLILGNHDRLLAQDYVELGFWTVHTSLEVNGRAIFHDPAIATIVPDKTCIVGHIHTLFKEQRNCINVGVDVRNFTPLSEEQIKEIETTLSY